MKSYEILNDTKKEIDITKLKRKKTKEGKTVWIVTSLTGDILLFPSQIVFDK